MSILFLAAILLGDGQSGVAPAMPVVTPGPAVTLAEALRAADERNLTLAATRQEIAKAEAQLEQAWGSLLPIVNGQLGYTRNDHADTLSLLDNLPAGLKAAALASGPPPADLVVRRQDDVRAGATATLPLVSPPAWLGIGAARLGVEVATLTVENARQQLLFAVAQAFWMAHINLELVGIQESQLKAALHHRDVARARMEAGDAMRIDVVRAETEVEGTRQDLLSAHLALDNARDALATLMASKELPLPVTPPSLQLPAEGALTETIAARPDVRSARASAQLAGRMVDVSWMQFLPSLGLSGQYSYLFSKPPDLGSSDRSRWSAMLVLSVPIYSELRHADLDSKRASLAQASLHEADLLAGAELEVRKAHRDYLASLNTEETAERQAALTREALALTESAYVNGASTSLDMTDAQRTNRTAELNAVAQRLRSQMALLTLMRVMGGRAESLAP